jgi:serine protease AprX
MKKLYWLLCVIGLTVTDVQAQYNRHIIQLTDKKGTLHSLANPSTYLSAKAIERRSKQKIGIDSTDLPVSAAYLDSIRKVPNVTVLHVSKWLNQVLIRTTDPAALARINAWPFVKKTSAVAPRIRTDQGIPPKFDETVTPLSTNRATQVNDVGSLNYGNTYNQIHIHEGEYLHDRGFTGQGITIAVLDGGFFGYKTNTALDSVRLQNRILGEWDFVANEASVNEDVTHGLYCFSIIAANKPGQLIGSAPHARFWLFRTEDTGSEYPVEEQNWAAAAEAADSAGADMISSSLGYVDFDNPVFDHTYPQRNGNTAMVTIAADLAAKKGMIVMNSAGNNGALSSDLKYISCPADGDSVVAVAATDINGNIASFSSWGPTGNGKLKPNIASVGQGTVFAGTNGSPASGNGTSYANPNMCGLIACLWQAFPEFTNMEIIDAVQKSAHKYNNPDARFGYGIPNFRKAYTLLEQERLLRTPVDVLGSAWIKALPVPFTSQLQVVVKAPVTGRASFRLLDAMGNTVEIKTLDVTATQVYTVSFLTAAGLVRGTYFIQYQDGSNKQTIAVMK